MAEALDVDSILAAAHSHHLTGDVAGAQAAIAKALKKAPEDPRLHRGLGILMLLSGDYANGWREYEWRWSVPGSGMELPPIPIWNGEPMEGAGLFIRGEQGLGDVIQFSRYADLCRRRGARIVLGVQQGMRPLMATLPWADQIIEDGETIPGYVERVIHMLSLPRLFQTRITTVPHRIPYLFSDEERVARWREFFAPFPGLKVGLAWQGNPENIRDADRSIALAQLLPLLQVPGVHFFGMQIGTGAEQAAALPAGLPFTDLGPRLCTGDGRFVEDAAAMMSMDLIITIDSALAHLAGALGRPTWTLLPFVPDWRWLMGRPDTPWYRTMRLFRQTAPGDWPGVVGRLVSELRGLAAGA